MSANRAADALRSRLRYRLPMPGHGAPLRIATVGSTRLEIRVADITTLDVDAIVNAPTGPCSAAAASTAPSIAQRDRN